MLGQPVTILSPDAVSVRLTERLRHHDRTRPPKNARAQVSSQTPRPL